MDSDVVQEGEITTLEDLGAVLVDHAKDKMAKGGSVPEEGAGIAIYYKDKILLTHPTNAAWFGTYSIPKGIKDEGETETQNAIRETEEEVGIKINHNLLGTPIIIKKTKDGIVQKQLHVYKVHTNDLSELGLHGLTESDKGVIALPKSSLQAEEIDWAGFVPITDAEKRIAKYQLPLLEIAPPASAPQGNILQRLAVEQKARTFLQLLSYKEQYLDTGLTKEDAFIERIKQLINEGYDFTSKRSHEKIAQEYGITDKIKAKELLEYSTLHVARDIAEKYPQKEAYEKIVALYSVQGYSTARTSQSEKLQQYSTPLPFAYLMSRYVCSGGSEIKYAYKTGDKVSYIGIGGVIKNGIVDVPGSVLDDGTQMWVLKGSGGQIPENKMLPQIERAYQESSGGGYKMFKGNGDHFRSYKDNRADVIEEAVWHKLRNNSYPKTGKIANSLIFEPTAGSGNLLVCCPPANCIVNELDKTRLNNLQKDGYKQVLNQDALAPFPFPKNYFDGMITNPPFGMTPAQIFNGFPVYGLENRIAANALEYVKPKFKAAILIGSNTEYDEKGRIAKRKDSILSYLWRFYNMMDLIEINGDLYYKQGTVFPIRIILLQDRKETPGGYFPLKDDSRDLYTPFSPKVVNTFEELYKRFAQHL